MHVQGEIKSAYYALCRRYHPDSNAAAAATARGADTTNRFTDISRAYGILGNFDARKIYDRELRLRGITARSRASAAPPAAAAVAAAAAPTMAARPSGAHRAAQAASAAHNGSADAGFHYDFDVRTRRRPRCRSAASAAHPTAR